MTNLGKILAGVVILAALAAVIVALFSQPRRENQMALFHMKNLDTEVVQNFDNLNQLLAGHSLANNGRWLSWKDEDEGTPMKWYPWEVETGKNATHVYYISPTTGQEVTTTEAIIEAWFSALNGAGPPDPPPGPPPPPQE